MRKVVSVYEAGAQRDEGNDFGIESPCPGREDVNILD